MNQKKLDFIARLRAMGEGECLTVARVASVMGINRSTAQGYLSWATAQGYLIAETVQYRPHIPQTLYWRVQND